MDDAGCSRYVRMTEPELKQLPCTATAPKGFSARHVPRALSDQVTVSADSQMITDAASGVSPTHSRAQAAQGCSGVHLFVGMDQSGTTASSAAAHAMDVAARSQ